RRSKRWRTPPRLSSSSKRGSRSFPRCSSAASRASGEACPYNEAGAAMSDRFELDRAALFDVLRERGVEDTRNLTLARAVAAWSDDPRYRRESIAVLLAQLTYLLGIAAHVAPRPKEFTPHCLLGLAGSYHGVGEMFMLCL